MRDEAYRTWRKAGTTGRAYSEIKLTVKGRVYRRTGGNWLRWNEFDSLVWREKLAEVTHYAESHGYRKVQQ